METNEERKNNGEDGDEEKPSAMIHERNGKYDVFVTVPVACLPDRKRPPTEVGGKPRGKHKKAKGTRETEEEADVRVVMSGTQSNRAGRKVDVDLTKKSGGKAPPGMHPADGDENGMKLRTGKHLPRVPSKGGRGTTREPSTVTRAAEVTPDRPGPRASIAGRKVNSEEADGWCNGRKMIYSGGGAVVGIENWCVFLAVDSKNARHVRYGVVHGIDRVTEEYFENQPNSKNVEWKLHSYVDGFICRHDAIEFRKLWKTHDQVIKDYYDLSGDDCVRVAVTEIEYHYHKYPQALMVLLDEGCRDMCSRGWDVDRQEEEGLIIPYKSFYANEDKYTSRISSIHRLNRERTKAKRHPWSF